MQIIALAVLALVLALCAYIWRRHPKFRWTVFGVGGLLVVMFFVERGYPDSAIAELCEKQAGTIVQKPARNVGGFVLVGENHCRDCLLVATGDYGLVEFEINRHWREKERKEIGLGPGLYRATVIDRTGNEKRCSDFGDYTLKDPKKHCVTIEKIARPQAKFRVRVYRRTRWSGIGQIEEYGRVYESTDGKTRYATYRSFTAASRLLFGYIRNPDASYLGFAAASCATGGNRTDVDIKKIFIPAGNTNAK